MNYSDAFLLCACGLRIHLYDVYIVHIYECASVCHEILATVYTANALEREINLYFTSSNLTSGRERDIKL